MYSFMLGGMHNIMICMYQNMFSQKVKKVDGEYTGRGPWWLCSGMDHHKLGNEELINNWQNIEESVITFPALQL